MHICPVVVRPLNLRHCVPHLEFERAVEPPFLLAEVALDDGDSFWWEVENLDPIDGIVFRPSQHNERQNGLEDGGLAQ